MKFSILAFETKSLYIALASLRNDSSLNAPVHDHRLPLTK